MVLLIAIVILSFVYAYNFFINYHILIVFISVTPLVGLPLFRGVLNPSLYLIIVLYWGLVYYILMFTLYSVGLIYIQLLFSYIFGLAKSLNLLYLLMY